MPVWEDNIKLEY